MNLFNITGLTLIFLVLVKYASGQLYSKSVNWDHRADGPYTDVMAKADIGAVTGWDNPRSATSGGALRVKLVKNAVTSTSGMVAGLGLPSGTAYELDFDVKFHSQFDWSRGGKVGFGFGIGNGNTGCKPPTDGAGGSLRIMWYQDNSNRVYFRPYVYHAGMPDKCGDNFDKTYPATGSIEKGKWYKVHMYVKSNTDTNADGRVQVLINGTTLIDRTIRWTTNPSKRFINHLFIHSFRGGSDPYWQSSEDHFIYYDNLRIKQLA